MAAHAPLDAAAFAEGLAAAAGGGGGGAAPIAGTIATYGAAASANERPERIVAASGLLRESGVAGRCVALRGRPATDEELGRVHSGVHAATLRDISNDPTPPTPAALVAAMRGCNYVFLSEFSASAARLAAGSAVEAVEAVLRGDVDSAVCVVRPPGHHAERDCMMGFCIANNVAVAAAAALTSGLERVLVVDWDIHSGNGTAAIFEEDPRVLVCSLHARDAYPWPAHPVEAHCAGAVGSGAGKGFTVNVAWGPGAVGDLVGDAEYVHAFDALLLPLARAFDPQLVLVSAGFDSAAGDEMGYGVTPAGYCSLTQRLMTLAGGKVVCVLEGGYNVVAVARGLHACTAALLGAVDDLTAGEGGRLPSEVGLRCVQETVTALSPFWPILQAAAIAGGET
jgi:histone deacetylase 6